MADAFIFRSTEPETSAITFKMLVIAETENTQGGGEEMVLEPDGLIGPETAGPVSAHSGIGRDEVMLSNGSYYTGSAGDEAGLSASHEEEIDVASVEWWM